MTLHGVHDMCSVLYLSNVNDLWKKNKNKYVYYVIAENVCVFTEKKINDD